MAPCAGPAAVVYRPLMETRGFPLFGLALAGSRFHGRVCTPGRLRRREAVLRETPPTPSGRVTSLRRQRSNQERRPRRAGRLLKLRLIRRLPCAARNRRPGRGFSESPSVSARACVIDAKAEVPVDSLITQTSSVKARCWVKALSEPPSSAAAGGAFRRSCLSPRSGRVLRRPPDASSAGESSAKPTTGEAGSPFLPTSLATQRSRAPAGARPGQRNAKQRNAAGLHQRWANSRVSNPGGGTHPGQRNAKHRKAVAPHQRTSSSEGHNPLRSQKQDTANAALRSAAG